MASFNKVILLGNLTRDPQLKYLPSQTPLVEFGLACNRRFKTQSGEDREEVLFVDCSAFGRQAEIINQYCQKGRPLFVEGRLKYDTWEDKQGAANAASSRSSSRTSSSSVAATSKAAAVVRPMRLATIRPSRVPRRARR